MHYKCLNQDDLKDKKVENTKEIWRKPSKERSKMKVH